jgi:hypothetical protein
VRPLRTIHHNQDLEIRIRNWMPRGENVPRVFEACTTRH